MTEKKYEKITDSLESKLYGSQTFFATIDEINGNIMFVTGMEFNDVNHRGSYVFEIKEDTRIIWNHTQLALDQLQLGNVISVTYSGAVLETAPGEIEDVTKIQLLDDELDLPEVDPWTNCTSLSEAEEIAGFKLELPEIITDSYVATDYRAIEKEAIEVTYVNDGFTVIIQRAIGVNKYYIDNSVTYMNVKGEQYEGELATYDITHFTNDDGDSRTLINGNGYSWTINAPNGYWGDSAIDFIHEICK